MTIKRMLESVDPIPFCFAGAGMLVIWKAATIDDQIFAECSYIEAATMSTLEVYYYLEITNEVGRECLYEEIITDFVLCNAQSWKRHSNPRLFDTIGGKDDAGLREILLLFGKSYPEFLNDVMYWFSVHVEEETVHEEIMRSMDEDDDEDDEDDGGGDFDDGYFGGNFSE